MSLGRLSGNDRAAATRLSLQVTDQGRILFELLDDDLDGRLTPRELRTAAGLLTTRDRDGDGALDSHEIPRRIKLELARGVDLPNQIRAVAGRNKLADPAVGEILQARCGSVRWIAITTATLAPKSSSAHAKHSSASTATATG